MVPQELCLKHYGRMPMQYTEIFSDVKIEIFTRNILTYSTKKVKENVFENLLHKNCHIS